MLSLYNKYRPQKFSEVLGQDYIVQILQNSVEMNKISHAYLFSGPKGTGKTTLARIFSLAVNCENPQKGEPCGKCKYCKDVSSRNLDIVEIDAASHTGVDNIRKLRNNIEVAPVLFRYKVYIIDEVHMLSIGAFNALLKSLEEPPDFVIFILATTELHKIPPTIISRCQKFDFRKINSDKIIEKLRFITEKEGYKIYDDALLEISNASEGGMRDAESLLDQIINLDIDKKITSKEVREILGVPEDKFFDELVLAIYEKNIKQAFKIITQIAYTGYDMKNYILNFISFLRDILIIKINPDLLEKFNDDEKKRILNIAEKFKIGEIGKIISQMVIAGREIADSPVPHLPIELAVVRVMDSPFEDKKEVKEVKEEEEIKKDLPANKNSQKIKKNIISSKPLKQESSKASDRKEPPSLNKKNSGNHSLEIKKIHEIWSEIVKKLKPYNHSLWGIIQNCQPVAIDKGNLILVKVKYDFYKTKLEELENKRLIMKIIQEELQEDCDIKYVLENEISKDLAKGDGSVASRLINDFGGEVI